MHISGVVRIEVEGVQLEESSSDKFHAAYGPNERDANSYYGTHKLDDMALLLVLVHSLLCSDVVFW